MAVAGASAAQATTAADEPPADRPTVGLVLSGGGAKGFAHIGVLQALEAQGVPIDLVVGTSMGAVVGGLYAAGNSPAELETAAHEIDWAAAFRDQSPRALRSMRRKRDDRELAGQIGLGIGFDGFELPRGAIQGQRLTQLLREHLGPAGLVEDFDDLAIPFRAVAADLRTGEPVTPRTGDLALAIRASMAIPGVVAPVDWDGHLLVDGALRANLPVEAARALGADVIIAVDVGRSRPREADLTGPFGVMDQAINVLVRRNVLASVSTLDAGDAYIRVDVDDISATDFGAAERAIAMGAQRARRAAPELADLALPAQAHARHLARLRPETRPAEPVIAEIRLDNRSTLDDRVLLRHLAIEPGEPLDREALNRSIDRIHGLGYFERVDYRLHSLDDGRARLDLVAVPQSWGPAYLRFGLAIEDDFDTRSSFRAGASYLLTEVNPWGAELQGDLELGSDPRIAGEFWQPLGAGSPWFGASRLTFSRRDLDLFAEGERIGAVRFTRGEFGLHVGRELGPNAELRAGIEGGRAETERLVGPAAIPDRRFSTGRAISHLRWDSLDHAGFPGRGSSAAVEWRRSSPRLGADDRFERITVDATTALSHRRSRWIFGVRAGTTRGTEEPPVEALQTLGGFLNLGGFQRDELTGSEVVLGQVVYLREFAGYRTVGGLPVFLGGAIEAGNTWDDRDERDTSDLIASGTLIAATDTLLGPLFLAWGRTDQGNDSGYLVLGHQF